MNKWKCCQKQPPETGKKVLCHQKGDLYVAVRLGKHYIPMPFADHYFSPGLSIPETWCEIDFPKGLTGHIKVIHADHPYELITLSELEVDYPEEFKHFAEMMISSMGQLKKPSKNATN